MDVEAQPSGASSVDPDGVDPVDPVDTKTLIRLAWPIVVSRSLQAVVGLSDALMVARLGETQLAASTTGALNTFMILILPLGVCFIVASFSSQMFGKGDAIGARRYGYYGLIVAGLTQLGCFALVPVLGEILGRTGSFEPAVLASITTYMSYRLLGGGAAVGFEALSNYYGGLGNTQLPMRVSVVAMLANIGFNAVLIFGLLGMPAMGIMGAGIGSALSSLVGFSILFGLFIREGQRLGTVIPRLFRSEFVRMIRFGLPAGFNWFFEMMAFVFFVNVVVADLGTTMLAAFMTALELNSVSFMPAFGLASAGAILVGQRIGAGDFRAVPLAVKRTFMLSAAWQVAVSLTYLLFPRTLFSMFVTGATADHEALLSTGAFVVMCAGSWQLCDAAATTLAESLRAAGDTAFTLYARIAIGWAIFVPGSYYTVRVLNGGVAVAVLWLVAYLGLLAGVLYIRFRGGAWQRIQLIERPPT